MMRCVQLSLLYVLYYVCVCVTVVYTLLPDGLSVNISISEEGCRDDLH